MHRKNVKISLDQDALVLTGYLVLREIYSVQGTALDIYFRLRRIDIFGYRLVCPEGPSTEGYDAAAHGMDREHHPVVETVHKTSVVIFDAQTCLDKEFLLISCCTGRLRKSLAGDGRPAEPIFPDGLVLQTAALEILVRNRLTVRSLHAFLEELSSIFRYKVQTFATLPLRYFFRCLLLLYNFDIILFGKIFQSLGI